MRKLVFISGASSASLFNFVIFFKLLHLQGAGILFLVSTILFSFIFVPCAAIYYYKKGK